MKIIKYIVMGMLCGVFLITALFLDLALLVSFSHLIFGTFGMFLQFLGIGTLATAGLTIIATAFGWLYHKWFE